jgi:predicted nuclease of restriction endonuclease-like (RecB) superfamily
LTERFGKGFSVDNLERMKRFFLLYNGKNSATPLRNSSLSWSHYLVLMGIERTEERQFYEIEAVQNQWSLNEFKRQLNSALYERLALSRDKKKIKQLSQKGQIVERTSDLIKEPYVLEFLGLQDKPAYSESQLEYHSECIPRSLLRG